MKFTIYKYTCPENKIYVGITINVDDRKRSHARKERSSRDKTKFAEAIRKFGFDNFKYEEIEYPSSVEQMREREKYWIKHYDCKNTGYNSDDGGRWTSTFQHNAEKLQIVLELLKVPNLTLKEISEKSGTSLSWVSEIKNGKKRNCVPIIRKSHQSQKGSFNKASKLTEAQVLEIQSQLASGTSRKEIQQKYSISKTLVQLITTQQAWNHVPSEYQYKPKETNGNAKLTPEIVREIKIDLQSYTQMEVSQKYNISRSTVQQIVSGKTWKHIHV